MPVNAQLHDGRVLEFPDGTDPAVIQATVRKVLGAKPETTVLDDVKQGAKDIAGGLVRGAGSIGATLLAPVDAAARAVGVQNDFIGRDDRRAGMDAGLGSMGVDTGSLAFKGGKLAAEVAGTAGAGGAVANTIARVPGVAAAAPNLLNAIRSGGFSAGSAGVPTRMLGGGINGVVSTGLVNPDDAGAGGLVGALLPPGVKAANVLMQSAGKAGHQAASAGANRLMQSAIKPTIAQLRSGDAAVAVNTLLERGINPTEGGVNKLRALIDDLDNRVGAEIAGSTATIDKQNVLARLGGTRLTFGNQVSPTGDLNAIQAVADDFMAHPMFPGANIPVQGAQELKRGTYNALTKKYGQQGSAEVEASKALARGLKEEISAAVPAVAPLNAELSKLITTLDVAERRALMEMNKNPMGLAALAQSPSSWAMFMADKSALFKSLAARMVNSAAGGGGASGAPSSLPNVLMQKLQEGGYRAAPVLATQD